MFWGTNLNRNVTLGIPIILINWIHTATGSQRPQPHLDENRQYQAGHRQGTFPCIAYPLCLLTQATTLLMITLACVALRAELTVASSSHFPLTTVLWIVCDNQIPLTHHPFTKHIHNDTIDCISSKILTYLKNKTFSSSKYDRIGTFWGNTT